MWSRKRLTVFNLFNFKWYQVDHHYLEYISLVKLYLHIHYSEDTWVSWCLASSANRLLIHQFVWTKQKKGIVVIKCTPKGLNSSVPSAAYMRLWTVSVFVQVMAYRLFGAKSLLEPMLTYCQLDFYEQTSVKFKLQFQRKCSWNWSVICVQLFQL